MIRDSLIKWDPKRYAFILTDQTYKHNVSYILNDPRKRDTPKYFQTCMWLLNYLTHTREHLPQLYHKIYGATIQDHTVSWVIVFEQTIELLQIELSSKK